MDFLKLDLFFQLSSLLNWKRYILVGFSSGSFTFHAFYSAWDNRFLWLNRVSFISKVILILSFDPFIKYFDSCCRPLLGNASCFCLFSWFFWLFTFFVAYSTSGDSEEGIWSIGRISGGSTTKKIRGGQEEICAEAPIFVNKFSSRKSGWVCGRWFQGLKSQL